MPNFWEEELEKYRNSISGGYESILGDEEETDFWNPAQVGGPGAPQEEIETGNVLDLLGSTLWGAVSGLTWGASEFVAESKPWEEMNSMERTGWVLGEGGSLFAPWGPFGVMGKGAAKIAKAGGNKFIQESATDAVSHIIKKNSDDIIRGAEKVATKSGRTVNEILVGLQDDTAKALKKTVQDDTGSRWLMELTEGGVTSAAMKTQLTMSSSHAVQEAFVNAGIKNVGKKSIKQITDAWTTGLSNGEYVNDVAHWLERGLKGQLPGNTRKFVSKYLGMAANDAWMMGAHSLISTNVKAYARGEEMPDQKELISHSGMMALVFPGIRMIGLGGKESLGTGIKSYMQRFKGSNYDQMLEVHGEKATKNLLRLVLNGTKKDLFSKTSLQGMKFKGLEKEYGTGANVLREIPNMSGGEAVHLLKHTNKLVSHLATKEWTPRFMTDLIASVPRMALGTLAMNPWLTDPDSWGDMDGKELAAHMFMGAAMTKGRGGWGRGLVGGKPDALRTSLADYTPYFDAMSKLNVDVGSLDATLKMHHDWDLTKGMGSSFNTNDAGQKIVKAFDNAFNDGESSGYTDKGYQPNQHGEVFRFGDIYNLAKGFADPNHVEIDMSTLSAKRLNRIKDEIESITFEGGESVKDLGFWGSIVKITADQAKGVASNYGNMMRDLGELGLPVTVGKDGHIHGREVWPGGDATDIRQVVIYNKTLQSLEAKGLATIKTAEPVTYEQMKAIQGKDQAGIDNFHDEIYSITRKWMDSLDAEFDGKMIAYEVHKNPYLTFLGRAREVESADRIHRVIAGTGAEKSNEQMLTSAMDNTFMRTDKYGKRGYLPTIDHYEFDGLVPESGNKEQVAKNDAIADSKAALRNLFELRKPVAGQINGDLPGAVIPRGALDGTAKSATDMMATLSPEWTTNFYENTLNMHMQRLFGSNQMDRRAVHLAKSLVDLNYGILDQQNKKLQIPSAENVIKELKLDVNGEQAKEVMQMHSFIKDVMGETVVETNYLFDQNPRGKGDTVDITALKKAYDSLQNVQFQDFMTEVQTKLESLEGINSNLQDNVETIFKDAERVRKALDPSYPSGDKQPLDSIESISKQIDTLVKMSKSPENQESLNAALKDLQSLSENIIAKVEGFDIAGAAKKATDNVQDIVSDIFVQEQEAKMLYKDTINKLLNLQSKGVGANGLEVSETMRISEELAKSLHKQLTGKDETKLLSDVMEEFNSTGYWSDATTIIKDINEQIHMQVIANSNHSLNNESYHLQKEMGERTKREGHRSLLEIGQEFNLMSAKDPNKFNPTFIKTLVTKGPGVAFDQIKTKIYADTNLSPDQKDARWRLFLDRDSLELGTHLLNQKIVKTISVQDGLLTFDNETPGTVSPRTTFFENEGYKVYFVDGKVSTKVRGKLVNIDIDKLHNNPDLVQQMITGTKENPNMRISGASRDFLDSLVDSGVKLSGRDIYAMGDVDVNPLMYMRISPRNKILFSGTKENIKNLNEKYNDWYAEKQIHFKGKGEAQLAAFEKRFGNLKSEADRRHTLELKMLLQYMDKTGQRGMFDGYIKELSLATPDATKLAGMEANMFKRGFLSDGGTTQTLNRVMLKYINTRHSDGAIRLQARKNMDTGITTGLFHDEMGGASPFNIKRVAKDLLTGKMQAFQGTGVGSLAHKQLNSIDEIKSLDFSVFDGAKFLSLDQAKLMFAMKGGQGEFNGAKSIIFGSADQQMLGKGYMVYHPDVARHMPKGVDMLIGESSAKTYSARNLNGTELSSMNFLGKDINGWGAEMNGMSRDHQFSMAIEGVGLSFTSKNSKAVNISPSIFDWQSESVTRQGAKWMKIDKILGEIQSKWAGKDLSNELGKLLYDITEENSGSFQQTYGDEAIAKRLIMYGASPDNPLIAPVIERLLRNEDFKALNNINTIHGQDNFITPNIMNDLTMPIYADIVSRNKELGGRDGGWNSNEQTYDTKYRTVAQVGGIGLNGHTMKRLYEGSGEMFYARDNQDIDWLVTVEDGKIRASSSFYNRLDANHRAKGNARFALKFQERKNINNASKLKSTLEDINKKAAKYNLTSSDIFNLLHIGAINSVNPATKKHTLVTLTAASAKVVREMNLEQAEMGHAVPKIGHDMIGHRIQKILNDGGYTMNGLVELNHWDLRVAHQRDHDGDHFTSFTKMPFDISKEFFKQNGMKKDFTPPTANVDNKVINVFGFGEKGIAGENIADTGFHSYANLLNARQGAVGQIIGARRSLSWASLAGLKMKGIGGSKSSPFLKDFSQDTDFTHSTWQKLSDMYNIMQGTVDYHGPRSKELEADLLWDNYFLGYKGKSEGGKTQFSNHSVFGEGHEAFGRSEIGQSIFKIVVRTLRKGNAISNDVWDEAGSRTPTPKEIRDIHGEIKRLFMAPDQFIIGELMKEVARIRFKDGGDIAQKDAADGFLNEIIKTFYRDQGLGDVRNAKNLAEFKTKLYKGDIAAPTERIFKFDKNLKTDTDGTLKQKHDAWGLTVGGQMMDGLVKRKVYWQSDMGGIPYSMYDKAGANVNGILHRVEFARALGEDFSTIRERMNVEDHFMPDAHLGEVNTEHMFTRGIAYDLLNRQYKQVSNQIRFFNEERFVNDTKLERLYEQQDNIAASIDIIDKSMTQNLVVDINKGRLDYIKAKTGEGAPKGPQTKEFDQKVFVYRVKGELKRKTGDVEGLGEPAEQVDYSSLDKLGYYDENGSFATRSKKPLVLQKGYTYIIDKNPRQKVSMTDPEYKYGRAAFEATYGDRTTPEVFMNGDVETFREQTRALRSQITSEYIKTSDLAREHRVLRNEIYNNATVFEQNTIDKYMKDYEGQVNTDGTLSEIGTLIRYVLQPQPLVREYYTAHDIDMPAYKMNNRLYQSVITWAETNGHGAEIKSLIEHIQTAESGRRLDHDISSYTNMAKDQPYDYTRLGAQGNIVRTIRENYSGFFASPLFEHQMQMVDRRAKGQGRLIRGVNGTVVGVRVPRPGKDKNRHKRGCE